MQEYNIRIISGKDSRLPDACRELKPSLEKLFYIGNIELLSMATVGIVGSRKVTDYGRTVTNSLVSKLAREGVTVVSGLALGVDSIAHRAALESGGRTVAVLPGSLRRIYPASHNRLAQEIINQGGLLISEYNDDEAPMKYRFIERNRIIAAVSDVVVVTEAAAKSGSLHTAEFALDLGKNLGAVPGNIDAQNSIGANRLFKKGAEPILSADDIFSLLNIKRKPAKPQYLAENSEEAKIIKALAEGKLTGDELLKRSRLDANILNINMTMLEIKGIVAPIGSHSWRLIE